MPAVVSLILGAIGWFSTKLLFEPLKDLWDLRMETQELLIAFGNLPAEAPDDVRCEAGRGFRRIGVALSSRHLAAWPWVRWFYEGMLRQDPYSAGEACMGLGKAILEMNYSKPNLGGLVPVIRKRLRLPTPYPTRAFRELSELMGWPVPVTPESNGE